MHGLKQKHHFTTVLSPIDGVFLKTAIFLPEEIIDSLPSGRVRVEGTCNDAPFALAVQHLKTGERYFAVSAALRRAARIKVGDRVDVVFRLVDPDKLDVPEELQAVLDQDEEAQEVWLTFTRGYQRGLIHYITSVKSSDARIRRALDLLERAKAKKLYGQQKK